jgi:hypothetical protein
MAEPNFDQMAGRMFAAARTEAQITGLDADAVSLIAEQLRLVWNARGAADIATLHEQFQLVDELIAQLECSLATGLDYKASTAANIRALEKERCAIAKTLDRALRTLDR